jgi:hypothetical protein
MYLPTRPQCGLKSVTRRSPPRSLERALDLERQPLSVRSPDAHRVVTSSLKTKMDRLRAELARLEAERDQADRLTTELLKAAEEMMMAAKETAPRIIESELMTLPRPWWRRLVG